jgi:hypothetical protein
MNAFDDYFAIMKLLNRMEGFKWVK